MTKPRWVFPRAKCPECGKVMAVRPPQGGDGSSDVFPRHIDETRAYCLMSRAIVKQHDYVDES